MRHIWSEQVDAILAAGRSLDGAEVRNWALAREDALLALEQLREIGVVVLGGDVYVVSGDAVVPSYDNWHCDQGDGESAADFLNRSIDSARNYISSYGSADAMFAMVPSI